ncbi:MAG: discoidin domain-containing protein [Actinoplanes sp.]
MAHPAEQQPDAPDGTPPPGDVPAARKDVPAPKPETDDGTAPAALPARVPFAQEFPGSDGPPPPAPAPRTRPAPSPLPSGFPSPRPSEAPTGFPSPRPSEAPTERNWPPAGAVPAAPVRPRSSRLWPISIAAAALVAGSMWWWSHDSAADETAQPPPAAGGVATVRITAPETATGSTNSGLGGDPVADGPTKSSAPPSKAPTSSKPAPSKKPPAPKASVNSAGSNLALRHNVTTSGTEGAPWKASNAVDGDPTSRWGSAWTDTQWLAVDLGARWQITEVKLSWEQAYSTAYRVQVSTDGKSWKSVYSTTNGEGGEVTVDAGKVAARYVRVYSTERNGQYGISLFELAVR